MRAKILYLFLFSFLCGKLFSKSLIYNVLDYGAVADTSVLSTTAIKRLLMNVQRMEGEQCVCLVETI